MHGWAAEQASLIRAGRLAELDLENIAEEIESVGRSERDKLGSYLEVLLEHLLKFQYQPNNRSASWRGSINNARVHIRKTLRDNPSLKPCVESLLADAYESAVPTASGETGIEETAFPAQCPWKFDEIIEAAFWPGATPSGDTAEA